MQQIIALFGLSCWDVCQKTQSLFISTFKILILLGFYKKIMPRFLAQNFKIAKSLIFTLINI
jgi:hypothetical protein